MRRSYLGRQAKVVSNKVPALYRRGFPYKVPRGHYKKGLPQRAGVIPGSYPGGGQGSCVEKEELREAEQSEKKTRSVEKGDTENEDAKEKDAGTDQEEPEPRTRVRAERGGETKLATGADCCGEIQPRDSHATFLEERG
ncbi:hypothetical protein NDU88_002499 [Pleurodeles waltl]|uniref:Uncharacterized protein n=1 Tax=Pleurodeles waltl TaxID=8319 RepID=A0AAV7VEK0_PLEWA|nr:hypothetical protein NDU88_002499 [Pleurodeles waltl]